MIVMFVVSLKAVEEDAWATELTHLKECIAGISRTADIDCEVALDDTSMVSMESDGSSSLVTGLCYQVYDGLSVPR
jgi:hypothetical protein